MPVPPSVCPHGTTRLTLDDFDQIWYLSIFRKTVENIQFSLKLDKNNGHNTWKPLAISYQISLSSYNEKCSGKSCRGKNTFCVQQLFFENRALVPVKCLRHTFLLNVYNKTRTDEYICTMHDHLPNTERHVHVCRQMFFGQ